MTTETFIDYSKNYLPGYTGHVPKKNEIFGSTAGQINKIITKTGEPNSKYDIDVAISKPYYEQNDYQVNPPLKDNGTEALQFGNHSMKGTNWIGGPNSNVKAQHVPGYAGYIPQVSSENLYGKSFAKTTGQAINNEYTKGVSHPPKDKYVTQNNAEYNKDNFRTLKQETDPAEVKDINDAFNFHDAEFQGIEISEKRAYMDLPTVGYQGFKSMYRMPTTQVNHRKDPFFNINPLRPKLNTKDITENEEFKNLTETQKSALNTSVYRANLGLPDNAEMKIPVVGYTGHRMGYRSQNFYGKNFKDCSIQSKVISKMAQ